MPSDEPLIPPLTVIQARLTKNQRERSLLRALFRLAVRVSKEHQVPDVQESSHEAERRGVAQ
jgi:hypothetical protein